MPFSHLEEKNVDTTGGSLTQDFNLEVDKEP
jgi:hypothetical protein